MQKKNKNIKGIPLSKINLDKTIITTEESVLIFFKKHPKEAFSIQMLRDAGYSSNIRKIIQKLTSKEKILQTSHQEEGKSKWEYIYYIKPLKTNFDLKKTKEGWELVKITINSKWFLVECDYDTDPNSYAFNKGIVKLTLGFPKEGDGVLYYHESDGFSREKTITSIRYSEIQYIHENLKRRIYICQEYDALWDFDIISPGKRSRVSKSTSIIEGEKLILWAGNVGFLFIINPKEQSLSIYPRYRETDFEGNITNDEDVNYFDINYGNHYDKSDLNEESFDLIAIGDIDEDYEAEIVKKEVNYLILRGMI